MKHCYALATPEFPDDSAVFGLSCDYQDYASFAANAERVAAAGYDGVDLVVLDPLGFDQDRVIAILHRCHLQVAAICTGELYAKQGIALCHPNPYQRRVAVNRFNTLAGFAAQLDAVVNIGRSRGEIVPGHSAEETSAWAVESFRAIAEYAGALGVRLALEPVNAGMMNFLNTAEQVQAICAQVNLPNFGYMLDTQHLAWEHDPLGVIARYGGHCLHVHLTDCDRTRPGTGSIDFDAMLAAFAAAGYDGAFSHESVHMEEDVEAAMAYMAPLFARHYGKTE